jgi:hypothetical protein
MLSAHFTTELHHSQLMCVPASMKDSMFLLSCAQRIHLKEYTKPLYWCILGYNRPLVGMDGSWSRTKLYPDMWGGKCLTVVALSLLFPCLWSTRGDLLSLQTPGFFTLFSDYLRLNMVAPTEANSLSLSLAHNQHLNSNPCNILIS